jgi:hypothetical protein
MPRFVSVYTMKPEDLAAFHAHPKSEQVTKTGIVDARNQIAGFLIIEAADIAAAAHVFPDHPHIAIFPGDGIDVTPVVAGLPKD